jgi:hypothetical protein
VRIGFRHFGLVGIALGLMAACFGGEMKDPSAKFGCGRVDGLEAIIGEQSANYVIFGEVIETEEAPAAFAELACQLAARQPKDKPVWVGLPDYIGGTTEAARAMRRRLDELAAKGAPIVLGKSLEGHTVGLSRREEIEREWASTIMANVDAAGAERALLLVPRSYGVAARVIPGDRRLEEYTPMALFLPEGQVVNLEIGQANGVGAPTIRIYLRMNNGYMGQIAFETVTPMPKSEPVSTAAPVKE